MPIYQFKCKKCRRLTEEMHSVTAIPDRIKCACGKMAKRQLSSFAAFTDNDVTWLPSAAAMLQPDGERPITTRLEYNKYLRDHNLECKG
jgi:putative FmdB family regulatory protein